MINNVSLTGNLVRDPELKTSNNNKPFANVTIAVRKEIKPTDPNERDADFFNITLFGKTAEFVCNYGMKGRLLGVTGRLQNRKYTNAQGVEVQVTEIIADKACLLDKPRDDKPAGDAGSQGGYQSRGGGYGSRPAAPTTPSADEYDPFADE